MKILALDSSGLVATVAVMEDDIMVAEYTTCYKKTHSQTLLPMLDEMKKMVDIDMKSIDAIAVTKGPGSFTGLRIGCATAKGLGFALGCPLVAIPTVDALAYNMYGSHALICPLMDARREQVYTGLYRFEKTDSGYEMVCEVPQCAISIEEIIHIVNTWESEVIFLGDGVPVHKEKIKELCKTEYSFAPAGFNRQRASSVALLGASLYNKGETVSADEMEPDYLRLSQAERERMEMEQKAEEKKA